MCDLQHDVTCLDGCSSDLQVMKADVEAALGVMNFAIYHKELTDMDEREAERVREQQAQKKRMAENDDHDNDPVEIEEDISTENRFEIIYSCVFATDI